MAEKCGAVLCVCTGIFPAPSYCRCVGGSPAQALLCTQCSGSGQGHGTWDRDNAGCGWHKGHLVQTGPAALADDNGEALGLVGVPGWETCTPSHRGTGLAEHSADEGSAVPVSPLPWSSPSHGAMGAGEGSLLQKREPAPAPPDLTSLQSEHPAPALALSRGRCWGQGAHHGEAPARTLGLPPGGPPPAQGGGDRDAGRHRGSPCPPQALSPAPQSISRDHAAFQPLGTSKHLPPALGLINLLPPGPSPSTRHFLPATRPAPGQAPLAPGPVPAPARGAAPCPRRPQPPSAWGCCWSWGAGGWPCSGKGGTGQVSPASAGPRARHWGRLSLAGHQEGSSSAADRCAAFPCPTLMRGPKPVAQGLLGSTGTAKCSGMAGPAPPACACTRTAAGLCYVGQRVPGVGLAGTCANGVRVVQAQRLGALHGACVCVHTAGVGAAPVSPHGLWVCIATPCSAHVCVCVCVLQRRAGGSVCVCVWLC